MNYLSTIIVLVFICKKGALTASSLDKSKLLDRALRRGMSSEESSYRNETIKKIHCIISLSEHSYHIHLESYLLNKRALVDVVALFNLCQSSVK